MIARRTIYVTMSVLLASCGSTASFQEKQSPQAFAQSAAGHEESPGNRGPDSGDQSGDARLPLPNITDPNETSFDLTLKTRADSARVSEPIDFVISLDTSNSITRHADALAAALPPFLASIDALGIKMNIRLMALDEYEATLKDHPEYGVTAPSWFFGKAATPSLESAFPSGRLFRSDNAADIAQLSQLIRAKARQPSQIDSEPMYCGLETFLSLLAASPGGATLDRHVLTVSDEDNDWTFKSYDLAGKLKAEKTLACGQARDGAVSQDPYQYDVDKRWTAYAYEETTAASTYYRYDAVIKTLGDCQSRFGNADQDAIQRYNLTSDLAADKATDYYSCVNANSVKTYACGDGRGWSVSSGTKYAGSHETCDAYAQATCRYFVDGVAVTETVGIDKARGLVANGATCQVTGAATRGLVAVGSKGAFGYANCAAISCNATEWNRNDNVLEAEKDKSPYSDCRYRTTTHAYRSLVEATLSGGRVTGFSQLAPGTGETAVSRPGTRLANLGGSVCANGMPSTLPPYVTATAADVSRNGTRQQQKTSTVALGRADVVKLFGVADADLVSYTETQVTDPARTTTFYATYALGNLAANVKAVGQQVLRKGEDEANQTLATYRHKRDADVESLRVYRDGGRYTDQARKDALKNAWKPLSQAKPADVMSRVGRTSFHALAKLSAASPCDGEVGADHAALSKLSGGASFDICQATAGSLSDFFDKLLRKVVESVVREYRLQDFAPGASVVEVRRAGSDKPLVPGEDYELVTLSDKSPGISFKKDVKAGEVFHVKARLK